MPITNPIRSKRVPRFVEEWCKDENGTRAALEAGWPESWAHVAASRLLRETKVQDMIAAQRAKMSAKVEVEAEAILREWIAVATADPSKLSRVRQVNCRYCNGIGNGYQWKAREYAEACDRAMRAEKEAERAPPDCSGGFGFVSNADPNPDCPECHGEGEASVYIADVSTLSGPERKLYAGVKMTRNGPEVILRDQDKARDNLAKYLGMLVEKRELTGKDGRPLVPTLPFELPTDPDKLAALYASVMGA